MEINVDTNHSFLSEPEIVPIRIQRYLRKIFSIRTAHLTNVPQRYYSGSASNANACRASDLLLVEAAFRYIRQRHITMQTIGAVFLAFLMFAITVTTARAWPTSTSVKWSAWQAVPDTGTKYNLLGERFLTDSGCSIAAPDLKLSSSTPLFIVAKRTVDHTIWINSTSDLSQWAGWRPVQGPQTNYTQTNYPPSASYYYDYGSNIYRLAVVAVGIRGGADDGVYLNTLNLQTNYWSGWIPLPGLSTDSGASVTGTRVYARRKTPLGAAPVYENHFSGFPVSPSGWNPVPGSFSTKVQVCAYSSSSLPALLAARYEDGQVCSNKMISPDIGYYYWSGWLPINYPATTDAKPAGPLGSYLGFFKGKGEYQIHGVLASGSELIPGNKLTDAGLDSCTLLYGQYQDYSGALIEQYGHLLFAKAMGDQKIYFTDFFTTVVLPPFTPPST